MDRPPIPSRFSAALLLGVVTLMLPLKEASAATEEDGRIWLTMTAQGKLIDDWGWYLELQPRWREEGEEIDQLLTRAAVVRKLSDRSSVWLGYGHVTSHPASGDTIDEHRLWQQYLHQFEPWGAYTFTSRTRLEERRVESRDDTGYRLRQTLRVSRPLSVLQGASLVIWDEIFFNANETDWGARSGFDQNRAFVGGAYKFSKQSRIELGYLNQYVRAKGDDKMNHVLSTSLAFDF